MEHLRCVVERITFRNEENGYSVIKRRVKGFADLMVVGTMPDVHVGSVLSLGGRRRVDRKGTICPDSKRDPLFAQPAVK